MSDRASLAERLVGSLTTPSDDPRAAQFVRGLALGALVGAAIAGSTLWQRRHARRTDEGTDGARHEDPARQSR